MFAVGIVYDLRTRRRRALRSVRHPWLTGIEFGLGSAIGPLIVFWRVSIGMAICVALVWAAVAMLIHALSWGPEGYQRPRYIRRYGSPADLPEHRWLPENSSWPY